MTVPQKQVLMDMQMAEEEILDGLPPEKFMSFKNFGPKYILYVRELRELPSVEVTRNMLDPEDSGEGTSEYERRGPEFHALSSGSYDVRLTMAFSAPQARWLERLVHRLPDMYPGDPEKQDLGFHISGSIMELMRLDTERHGAMSNGSTGTVTASQLHKMKGGS